MQGLALVDHDNFRRRDRKSQTALELDTRILVEDVTQAFATTFPETRELDIRLYGGWTDPTGQPSRDASWLHGLLPDLRGRRHGLVIRPALATTMIQFPKLLLRGTVRGHGRRQRQKMVDGMMGCDAIQMAGHSRTCVGIVTDDDDLLPATLSAHHTGSGMVAWIRARTVGSGINDSILLNQGLRIHQLGA